MREVSAEDARMALVRATAKWGATKAFAESIGVCAGSVTDVKMRRRRVTERMAKHLGFDVKRQRVPGQPGRASLTYWVQE